MKIGIIGSGYIGSTLTRLLTGLGHTVYLSNATGPDSLKAIAEETGAIASTVQESATSGEIVIVTIPQKNIPDLPVGLFDKVGSDVIVVDTGNYYPTLRDGAIEGLDNTYTDSEWVAKHLGRPVIKAFNSIMYLSLANGGKPKGSEGRIGLPVAGDDPVAKAKIMELVNTLGFDPVDGGTLKESWRQQPGSPVYCTDLSAQEIKAEFARFGSIRTPEHLAEIVERRTNQEKDVIKASPNDHYGSANHKRPE